MGIDKKTFCQNYGVQVLVDDDARHLARLSQRRVKALLLKAGLVGELFYTGRYGAMSIMG